MEQSAPPHRRTDGRLLRSERTKQVLIESYLDLLRENPQVPTASDIARRAGCSVRSVFERFSDLLTLSFAAADYAFAQGMAQAVARNVDGDRQTRLKSQVETRAAICERWLPLWRALLRHQHESEELALRIERMRDAVLGRLQLMYRPELSTLSGIRPQGGVDRPGSHDRFRELGSAAGASRPLGRGGPRHVDRRHRPHPAADADGTLIHLRERDGPLRFLQ